MAVIHITELEALRDMAVVLARVREGAEVVIEDGGRPPVWLRAAPEPTMRRLSESLRLAMEHRSTVTLDDRFGDDVEAAISSHPEPLSMDWE